MNSHAIMLGSMKDFQKIENFITIITVIIHIAINVAVITFELVVKHITID